MRYIQFTNGANPVLYGLVLLVSDIASSVRP